MNKLIPLAIILALFTGVTFGGDSMVSFLRNLPDQPEKMVEIFPNPVTEGHLTISSHQEIILVQILNITGKIVFTQEYQPNTSTVAIELSKIEKGIYLVRIGFSNRDTHTEKIMIK
jgi:hypothetical protein